MRIFAGRICCPPNEFQISPIHLNAYVYRVPQPCVPQPCAALVSKAFLRISREVSLACMAVRGHRNKLA
eukprot:4211922-Pleurochrysis_carterae.AAC.1